MSGELPPVPDHIREAARIAPDHWFGMVDPAWAGEDAPPDWAMVGQWRSDQDGEIVEWRDNAEYRPSPSALGWPDPTDPVDAAVQLAATGYGPGEEVARTLAQAEVAVFVAAGDIPLRAVAPDGETLVVPVFTSPEYLHAAGRLFFKSVRAPELIGQIPQDHLLYLNPSGPVSMTLETEALREAVAAAATDASGTALSGMDDAEADPDVQAGAEAGAEAGVGEWTADAAGADSSPEADADGDAAFEEGWLGALDDLLPAPAAQGAGSQDSPESRADGLSAIPDLPAAEPEGLL